MWDYLEKRVGVYCLTKAPIKVDGMDIPKETMAVIKQIGDQHPFVTFGEPFAWLQSKDIGKKGLLWLNLEQYGQDDIK